MPIELHAKSQGVTWNGETLHLLEYSSIQLAIDDAGRLSGALKGALVTFDDVNYEVSAAVFDAAGLLIGTARATCHVDRVWLGRVLMMPSELALDFGVSKAFSRAAWVTVGISECTVKTPDQWQKDG